MIEIKAPSVGESITEVKILEWHKLDGSHVKKGELLLEIESDKASVEIIAEASGLLNIKKHNEETVVIGELLATINDSVAQAQAAAPQKNATQTVVSSSETIDVMAPSVGESITEVKILEWLVDHESSVKKGQVIVEIESDKASVEVIAEASGVLFHTIQSGETVQVNSKIAHIQSGGNQASSAAVTNTVMPNNLGAPTSPSVRRVMAEKNVQKHQLTGTGPNGRITHPDVLAPVPVKPQPVAQTVTTAVFQKQKTQIPLAAGQKRVAMSSLRKTIARRLVQAQHDAAILTTFNEVDLTAVKKLRAEHKVAFKEKHGVGLGFMSFFTKASQMALKEIPEINAYIDGTDIIYNEHCHVGVAVGTPKGLVVPVLRNVENMKFVDVEKEIVRLAMKARDGKLGIKDMTGGTFTISNGGVYGSMLSTPILNPPQSGILGMHNIIERPMAVEGQVVIRPMMYLALSYDHRIVDGKGAVTFLIKVKEALESPETLGLDFIE